MNQITEKGKKTFKIIFLSFAVTMILHTLCVAFAMVFYPGGSYFDLNSARYSFLHNFVCDMRELIAVNGKPNVISSSLLKTGIVLFACATMTFFITLCFFFQRKKSTKYFSILGAVLGVIQGPFFILMFFLYSTPDLHMVFTTIAPLLFYLVVILYTILFFIDKSSPKLTQYSFLVLAILSIIFSIVVGIETAVDSYFLEIVARSLWPNLFIYLTAVIFILQGFSLYSFFKK